MRPKFLALTMTFVGLVSAFPAFAGADWATWISNTPGTFIPAADMKTDRGTMVAAVAWLRNTSDNSLSLKTWTAAQLKVAGHLSLADGANGTDLVVESLAYIMVYPGGIMKPVFMPRGALPADKRPYSLVFDEDQLTTTMQAAFGPNLITNPSMFQIDEGCPMCPIKASQKCNFVIHQLSDPMN